MASTVDLLPLKKALALLPQRFKGPGGVVGVVADGKVLATQAWGYADMATGKAMTVTTRLPICSISKQFTCAVLLDMLGDPARLDGRVADFLPNLQGRLPTVANLCNMQSGLRDYWAMTVLHGARHDGVFSREDALPLLAHMRTVHFAPGQRYSYSNGNFRILAELLEAHSGRTLAELYARRLFEPANMHTAELTADTSVPADGVVGYEGNESVGFFPASNGIYWIGDAGISASMEDMLAWESYIDATRDDPQGLYRRLAQPQTFSDGKSASYGFGLSYGQLGDVALTGHGGALRGFRLHRLHAASKRLSVVVLFNHEADAYEAASMVMRAALGQPEPVITRQLVAPEWEGRYLDRENGLLLDISIGDGQINAHYATSGETLGADMGTIASSPMMKLRRDGEVIELERLRENLVSVAGRIAGVSASDLAGRYFSPELDGTLEIKAAGNALSGRFHGMLGDGLVHPVYPVGADVFVLSCRRSMDAPAPGNWTIQIKRNEAGDVCGLMIGCWLARNVSYQKIG
ncbi:D-aminopeptidase [Aquamicrobium segne]|uniref:D-aminopeptidase n=1 Tax=Aquamicrobium segne TaxID=469547 RepID=A0ABW0GZN5_9HYPH